MSLTQFPHPHCAMLTLMLRHHNRWHKTDERDYVFYTTRRYNYIYIMKVSCTLLLRPEAKGHVILHDWLVTHAHGQLVRAAPKG